MFYVISFMLISIFIISKTDAKPQFLQTTKLNGPIQPNEVINKTIDIQVNINNFSINVPSNLCESMNKQNSTDSIKGKSSDGYIYEAGLGYYRYFKDATKWHDASKICQKDGAHLVILNSQEEAIFLLTLINNQPKPNTKEVSWSLYTFIGFHDQNVEGQYLTVKGDPLCTSGYWQWAPGQPDNANGNEHCGAIRRTGQLYDYWCYAETDFVCERDL